MTTPPPLPNGKHSPEKQKPHTSNSSGIWLIVGCSLAGLLLIAALLLYFLTDLFNQNTKYDYDDGNRNEKVLRKQNPELNETQLLPDVSRSGQSQDSISVETPMRQPRIISGHGINGYKDFSMEMHIDSDGNISGTYWNILYNIEFSISGHELPDGSLDLTLRTVKDNVSTHILLTSDNGYDYSGSWGKNSKPVSIALYDGGLQQKSAPATISGTVQGPDNSKILNQEFYITEEGDNAYYWYPSQGYQNRLNIVRNGNGYTIYSRDGTTAAEIYDITYDDYLGCYTALMRDTDGQTFHMTWSGT